MPKNFVRKIFFFNFFFENIAITYYTTYGNLSKMSKVQRMNMVAREMKKVLKNDLENSESWIAYPRERKIQLGSDPSYSIPLHTFNRIVYTLF